MTDRREAAAPGALPRGGSGAMFDGIAERYDLLNRLLSFGIDQGWRRRCARALRLYPQARILDLATGTGDLALEILKLEPRADVIGLDPSPRMLAIAAHKATERGARLTLLRSEAERLPFLPGAFDGVAMAFGIRNLPDRLQALREMGRVTRPGGRISILELSEPRSGLLGPLARFHIHTLAPRLGALLSGSREYRYLEDSIARFPPPGEFAALLASAGLDVLEVRPLTLGACCLFVAEARA